MLSLIGFCIPLKAQTQQLDLSAFLNITEVRRISVQENSIKRPMLTLNNLFSNANRNYQKGYDLEYILRNPTQFTTHSGASLNS